MTGVEVFVRLLDGSTLTVSLARASTVEELKSAIELRTAIPIVDQRIRINGRYHLGTAMLCSDSAVFADLSLSLAGGKGGFGTLLRSTARSRKGVADRGDMRDLQGRRLRDVSQSEALADWQARHAHLSDSERKDREREFKRKLKEISEGKSLKECRFGSECRKKAQCRFSHPDADVDSDTEDRPRKKRRVSREGSADEEESEDDWEAFDDDCFTVPSDADVDDDEDGDSEAASSSSDPAADAPSETETQQSSSSESSQMLASPNVEDASRTSSSSSTLTDVPV